MQLFLPSCSSSLSQTPFYFVSDAYTSNTTVISACHQSPPVVLIEVSSCCKQVEVHIILADQNSARGNWGVGVERVWLGQGGQGARAQDHCLVRAGLARTEYSDAFFYVCIKVDQLAVTAVFLCFAGTFWTIGALPRNSSCSGWYSDGLNPPCSLPWVFDTAPQHRLVLLMI